MKVYIGVPRSVFGPSQIQCHPRVGKADPSGHGCSKEKRRLRSHEKVSSNHIIKPPPYVYSAKGHLRKILASLTQ